MFMSEGLSVKSFRVEGLKVEGWLRNSTLKIEG